MAFGMKGKGSGKPGMAMTKGKTSMAVAAMGRPALPMGKSAAPMGKSAAPMGKPKGTGKAHPLAPAASAKGGILGNRSFTSPPKAPQQPVKPHPTANGATGAPSAKANGKGGKQPRQPTKPPPSSAVPQRSAAAAGAASAQQLLLAQSEFSAQMEMLTEALCDLSSAPAQVDALFHKIKTLRSRLLALHLEVEASSLRNKATGGPAGPSPEETELRRNELLVEMVQVLTSEGSEMAMAQFAGWPSIQTGRKGVVAKIIPFLQKYPETFEVFESTSEEGKTTQMVRLIGDLPEEVHQAVAANNKGMKRKTPPNGATQENSAKRPAVEKKELSPEEKEARQMEKEAMKSALLERIVEMINDSEERVIGVKDIGADSQVKELRSGHSKLQIKAFISEHSGTLALEEVQEPGRTPDYRVRLAEDAM